MKIPRDLNSRELIKLLGKFGYVQSGQVGSYIGLTKSDTNGLHITIPNHNPVKLGTLNNILKEVAAQLSISKIELMEKLFS